MKLNDKQKTWLIDEGYITAYSLDADSSEDWKGYYLNRFDWALSNTKNNFGFYEVTLLHKTFLFSQTVCINLASKDKRTILNIG